MAAEAQKVIRQIPALVENRMTLAETTRRVWLVHAPVDTEPEDLLSPAFWAHNAARFTQLDAIEVWAEDMSWYAELRVLDSGNNWAKVHCKEVHRLQALVPERTATLLAGHTVKWGGPYAKWRVIRDVDQHVLKDKLANESDGYAWLASYGKTVTST